MGGNDTEPRSSRRFRVEAESSRHGEQEVHSFSTGERSAAPLRSLGRRRRLWARRPVSRVLCRPAPEGAGRGGHSSGPALADRFSRRTRAARTGDGPALPYWYAGGRAAPIWSCSGRGLPCGPPRGVPGALLPHPFTLPSRPEGRGRRSAFCGAVPGIAPGGRYPPPCRRGARTFLDTRPAPFGTRACRDRPAVWPAGGVADGPGGVNRRPPEGGRRDQLRRTGLSPKNGPTSRMRPSQVSTAGTAQSVQNEAVTAFCGSAGR